MREFLKVIPPLLDLQLYSELNGDCDRQEYVLNVIELAAAVIENTGYEN